MKRVIFLIVVLIGTIGINAQEYCSFNANNALELDAENGTALAAGTVIGETASVIATTGADDIYKPQSVKATVGGIEISGGLQGSTSNPRDIEGGTPSTTLAPPATGSFIVFHAKADGYLYVVLRASSNKAHTVFEDGKAVSYTFAATGDETTDLGAVYYFTLPYTVINGQNAIQNSVEWAEQEYLKASAPEKYAAHWSEEESGFQTWNKIGIMGVGVIKFPVRKGSKYIVNSNGAKITSGGFYFDTTGDADVKVNGVCILESDQKLPPPLPIQNITFADNTVKTICVNHWDTNGDGELSPSEAAAVTDLGTVFKDNKEITAFDELQYFTGISSIGDNAFSGSSITSVIIPNSVTLIGNWAFYDCANLTSVSIPDGVTSIGSFAFQNCIGLTSATIPSHVTFLGMCAFYDCTSLTTVTIPNSITSISAGTFHSCSMTTIDIPNSVKEIGYSAFGECANLTSVNIPNSVTSIGDYSFSHCSNLASVTIPSSVTIIGEYAFYGCSLTAITSEIEEPFAINENVFSNKNALLIVPEGKTAAYQATEGWNKFSNIKDYDPRKRTIHVETAGTLPTLISADEKYQIEELTLTGELNGTDIHFIRDMAGVDMDRMEESELCILCNETVFTKGILRSLDLSDANIVEGGRDYYKMLWSSSSRMYGDKQYTKANTISESMFVYCRPLVELILPRSVTSISPLLFADNYGGRIYTNIKELRVAEGNPYYVSLSNGIGIIENNSNTLILGLTNNIPSSITSIGNDALNSSSFISMTIPNSVKSIGEKAFNNSLLVLTEEATTPPSITENSFPTRANIVLHVPAGSVEAYANADYWKDFKSIGAIGDIMKGDIFTAKTAEGMDLSFCVTNVSPFEAEIWSVGEYDNTQFDKSTVNIVSIPSSVIGLGDHEYNVTGIGSSAFRDCSALTSVTIPNSVTSIGGSAFYACSRLTSITIPNSVETIGSFAFSDCSGLTSVTIPNSVTSIGNYAFSGCKFSSIISEIEEPFAINENVFSNKNALLIVPEGKTAAYQATEGWNKFKNIRDYDPRKRTIHVETAGKLYSLISAEDKYLIEELTLTGEINGSDLSVIRDMAGKRKAIRSYEINSFDDFDDTDGRLSVLDMSDVKIVRGGVYLDFDGLDDGDSWINLAQDDVIPTGVFYGCKKLTSISVPSGLKNVGTDAFEGTAWYENQPEGLVYIGNVLYKYKGDMPENYHITIKEGTIGIANSAFYGRSTLSSIDIPESVKYIGINDFTFSDGRSPFYNFLEGLTSSNVFRECTSLTTIDLPNGVTYIGKCAFGNCSGLTSVTIPNSLTSIGPSTFSGCSALTSVTIPNSVTSISGGAFSGCSALTSVTIPNSVTSIGGYAFSGCSGLTSVTIPNSVTSIGSGVFADCSNLATITVEAGNTVYNSPDGSNAIIETTSNKLVAGCKNTTIPNSVTSIGDYAFRGCNGLTSMTIPNSVTSIGGYAFFGCSGLTSVTIPNSVTSIGYYAFYNCNGLTSVTIPNSVTSIDWFAFWLCKSLISVTVDIQEPLAITYSIFDLGNQATPTLYVPKGSKAAYEAANVWKDFKEIKEFAKDEEVTCALEDDNTATVMAANDPTEKDLVISESVMIGEESHPVTAIGEGAFKDNTELALVCIPETIEEIGNNAFAGCSGLTAIYSYSEEPIVLDGGKATVRTRADGGEVSASTVFALVDKNNCILYVPLNSADKYRAAEGWGEFENIVEMKSNKPGDANNDGEIDGKDVDATVGYIMEGKTDSFIFKNADVKADSKINAADIVKIVNLKK